MHNTAGIFQRRQSRFINKLPALELTVDTTNSLFNPQKTVDGKPRFTRHMIIIFCMVF
jgi:hypothetical protein